MLVDTHCHLHDSEFFSENQQEVYLKSIQSGVQMVCVGTSEHSSAEAVEFCAKHTGTYPVVGVHPHEAKHGWDQIGQLLVSHREQIIGVGEVGLDYYYNHSPKNTQIEALEAQIQLALMHNLPISFHVRSAYDDFWPILDNFHGVRGVLHSFTDTAANAEKALARGLYLGLNGISTFTKDPDQIALFTSIAMQNIVLETDAPYLTPSPFRGKINIPAYVGSIADFHAGTRNVPLETVASATTANAEELFGVKFSEYQPANNPDTPQLRQHS